MSKQYLGPSINFQGRAREAMQFYQKILGGNLELQMVDKQGAAKSAGLGEQGPAFAAGCGRRRHRP